jgi:hypothetical protein
VRVAEHSIRGADYGSQLEAGAAGVGDERLTEPGSHGTLGSPSGAVGGNDDAGHQRAKVVQDPWDERLEDRSAEVEPAHHGVERAFFGQAPGVAADVDDPGVAAAADHHLASRRVLEKAGMTLVRIFHQPWPYQVDGRELGDAEYAVSKAEWDQQNGIKLTIRRR